MFIKGDILKDDIALVFKVQLSKKEMAQIWPTWELFQEKACVFKKNIRAKLEFNNKHVQQKLPQKAEMERYVMI